MRKLISTLSKLRFWQNQEVINPNPVEWRFLAKCNGNNTFTIHITAFIESPWHIYTEQVNHPEASLLNIEMEQNAFVIPLGKFNEIGTPIEQYDPILNHDIRLYKIAVNFVQTLKIVGSTPIMLKGIINYVISDGKNKLETHKKEFEIPLNENP
jgi:thiol:disulfide interchange protein DsbD